MVFGTLNASRSVLNERDVEEKDTPGSVNVRIDLRKQNVDSDQTQGGHGKDEQQRQEMPTFDPSALRACQLYRRARVLHGCHRDEVFIQLTGRV